MKNIQPFLLRFTSGSMNTRQFTLLPGESYIIGSQPDTDIRVDGDPTVSRRHACISFSANGKLNFTDLNSTNGSRLNGRLIKDSGRLKPGDSIQLGLNTQCNVQPWEALESSLPPGLRSGFDLIPRSATHKPNALKMTAPLWFTVSGFCIGGVCFSLWQAFDTPNNVFARTNPTTLTIENPINGQGPRLMDEIVATKANSVPSNGTNNKDIDVPLVASYYVWDEIVNISQRFGEIPPSAMDPQFLAQVEHWIQFYTKNNRHLELIKRRDIVWDKIQKILQTHALPGELGYIAWVESAFDAQAVSSAGAVGMWQFIESTGQEYGLINSIAQPIDSRRQVEASTHAAARYLNSLLGQFGNRRYLLALAAYNAGQNRIKRQQITESIRTAKQIDFWHLKETLPKETLDYVPKVLAAIIIGRNPENW